MNSQIAAIVDRIKSTSTIIPTVLALLVLGAAFVAGIRSGVADSIGMLDIDITGLTAALSSDTHGLQGSPYQGYEAVRDALRAHGLAMNALNFPRNFKDYDTLTAALQAGANVDVCGSPLISQIYNDQGVIEFMHAAFSIFGVNVQSLYYFYFTILMASVIAYLLVFRSSYAACALLFACAVSIYAFMPSILRDNSQLIGVSNPRFLSTLGIIPLLHIFLTFVLARSPLMNWRSFLALLFQAALVNFAVVMRSSALWMEIAFGIAVALYGCWIAMRCLKPATVTLLKSALYSRGAVALYVAAMLFVCTSARAFFLLPSCGVSLGEHTFWHNVFLGFRSNPQWHSVVQADFHFKPGIQGDELSYTAATEYAEENHLNYQTKPTIWVTNDLSRRLGADPLPFGSWDDYERIMKAVVFDFVRAHPLYTVETFLIYKPLALIHDLRDFFAQALKDLLFVKLLVLALMIAAIGRCAPRRSVATEWSSITPRKWRLVTVLAAVAATPIVVVIVHFRNWIPPGDFAFMAVLVPFLVAGGAGTLLPILGRPKEDEQGLKFHQVTSVLAFCFVMSTAPLMVAYSDDYLIADQAFLAVTGVLFTLIWIVGWERLWKGAVRTSAGTEDAPVRALWAISKPDGPND